MFYCLVVGSRTINDYDLITQKLNFFLRDQDDVTIVSGGARGVDSLAKRYAYEHNYTYMEFPAKWDTYGKSAGYIRNEEMHRFISDKPSRGIVAFWDGTSKGTKNNFNLANKYNIPIRIVRVTSNR